MPAAADMPECNTKTGLRRVTQLLDAKQYDQAGKMLDQLRACPAHSPLETFQLGWLYGRDKRFEDALKIFETVPRDVPDALTHDYAIALSRFELAQYQGAIDVLKPHQLSGTADEKAVSLLAVSYSMLHLYREAYGVLSEQVQRGSSDITTYLNLVTVCAEGGNYSKAADVAAQAMRQFPDSPDAFIVHGAAETQLGQLDQAHADFAKGVQLAPSRADARFFLALIDYKENRLPEAISILRTAVDDGIADSDLHYLMAECLLKLPSASTDAALRELNRAIELNTNSVSARTLRGKLLLDTGHPNDARADLEVATHRNPDSRAAIYNLARAYRALGRTTESDNLFRKFRTQTSDTLDEFTDTRLTNTLTGRARQQP